MPVWVSRCFYMPHSAQSSRRFLKGCLLNLQKPQFLEDRSKYSQHVDWKKTWCGITTAPLDCRLELVSTSIPFNFVLWNFHPLEWHNAKQCLSHMSLETVKQHQYFMLTTQCFPFQLIVDTINCLRGLTRSIYRSPSTHCLVALRQYCSMLGSMYCLEKRSCQLNAVWYMVLVGHALGISGI